MIMNDPVFLLIYNLIYSAVTKDGRDRLFGDRLDVDNDVFSKSYAGNEFPEIWFELPLSGRPWYDLHVLTSKSAVDPDEDIPEGIFHPRLFQWFSKTSGVKQLALSHDLSNGIYDNPAVQLLVGVRDPSVGCNFLKEAGNHPAVSAYSSFLQKLPAGWFACYLGTFPERDDVNLRVECIPDNITQELYSSDKDTIKRDLAQVGLEMTDEMIDFISFMANQPLHIEFQFNVDDSGNATSVLGVSLRFLFPAGKTSHLSFSEDNENVVSLMAKLSDACLCDDRWRLLPGCAFANRLKSGDVSVLFGGYLAGIKVRMHTDRLLDAKVYIVANIR